VSRVFRLASLPNGREIARNAFSNHRGARIASTTNASGTPASAKSKEFISRRKIFDLGIQLKAGARHSITDFALPCETTPNAINPCPVIGPRSKPHLPKSRYLTFFLALKSVCRLMFGSRLTVERQRFNRHELKCNFVPKLCAQLP